MFRLFAGLILIVAGWPLRATPLAWVSPHAPFQIADNTWYVGSAGLSVVLIDSGDGLVLIDGGMRVSAPLVLDSVRALGFDPGKVRYILNSHAHFDHAGGIAELARRTGAQVIASRRGAEALIRGGVTDDDPQAGFGPVVNAFPAVEQVREIGDGEVLTVGTLRLRAVHTPGHTPGSTSWTWRSCRAGRCLDIVYADSLNAVAAPGFRFSAVPGLADRFAASITRLAALRCDVLISVHPEFSDLFGRAARSGGTERFVDSGACARYAADAERRLRAALAAESTD